MTIIDKLERADGPDRELDCLIALATGGFFTEPNKGWPDRLDYVRRNSDGSTSYPGHGFDQMVPAYTASIDAAMTLVPEGWEWSLYSAQSGFRPQAQLETEVMRQREGFEPVSAFGATPALALCIAALRARSQGGE